MRQKGRRIQLENIFEKNPSNSVRVCRPSIFGNPYKLIKHGGKYTIEESLELYDKRITFNLGSNPNYLNRLIGKNLICFCRLEEPCHIDILLKHLERIEQQNKK